MNFRPLYAETFTSKYILKLELNKAATKNKAKNKQTEENKLYAL